MIKGDFTYEKPKVIQALRYHFIARPEIKWMIILVNIFAIVAAALFFFNKVSAMAFLVSSLLWIILVLAFWYFLPYSIYRGNRTFKDHFSAYVSEEDFTIATGSGRRSWNWPQFSHFIESPHFFHLYFTPRSFFLVPKAGFVDADVAGLRKHLQQHILKRK